MWTDLAPGAELAETAAELRESAVRDEAAGLIPPWEASARLTGAAILENWGQTAAKEATR